MYECKSCNYETHDSGNFTRHKNTKKHMQNVQKQNISIICKPGCQPIVSQIKDYMPAKKQYVCPNCFEIFVHRQSLHKHIKFRCYEVAKSTEEKSILKETIDKLEKQNQALMNIVQNQSKSVENNSETIKKSMNVLSFVSKQYPNAPAIEELEYDKFNKLTKCLMYDTKSKKKIGRTLEEIILFYFKNDNLPEILGKAIVEEYKKDNPNDQSMWASDVSRLSFIVKSVIGKTKKSKWISDKNGVHFAELIIKPMFEIIKEKMREYIKKEKLEDTEIRDDEMEDITIRLGQMQNAGELIRLINLSKLDGKVLKYVAPYFNLNIDNLSDNDN